MSRRAVIAGISPSISICQCDGQQLRFTNPLFMCPMVASTGLMRDFIALPALGWRRPRKNPTSNLADARLRTIPVKCGFVP
jgi:hypothetical protein